MHPCRLLLLSICLLATAPLWAAQPGNGDLDARMLNLTSQLRCLVCQNETLADSKADLAVSLRHEIRAMMQRGATDQQVVDFLVARYGDFVLYRPPVKESTWLLWFGPVLLFAGAGVAAGMVLRRQRGSVKRPLSSADRDRVERILQSTREQGPP